MCPARPDLVGEQASRETVCTCSSASAFHLGHYPKRRIQLAQRGRRARHMGSFSEPRHHPVVLSCPHCHKENSIEVVHQTGVYSLKKFTVKCAYCGNSWEQELPGPVLAGPFPM